MAPPSKLAITTSALKRLMKDKASYGKEEIQQEQRIKKLETETGDENAGYILEQERKALQETKNMFPKLDKDIAAAAEKLKDQLAADESSASSEDVSNAKETLEAARA